MESILKDLYYQYYQNNCKKGISNEERELIRLLEINRGKLEALLNAEQKERLDSFITSYEEFYGQSCLEEFVCGMKLGGKMVAEMLLNDMEV